MYEARQNKEKVSRKIDGGGIQQRMKIERRKDLQSYKYLQPVNGIIQCVKTIAIESAIRSQHIFLDAIRADRRKRQVLFKHTSIIQQPNITLVNRFSRFTRANQPTNVPQMGANQLQPNELLIIVSHGSRYLPFFALKTPRRLAEELFNSGILPIGYHGQIYLDGCHTGEPGLFGNIGDGSSYAERFKTELLNISGLGVPIFGNFTVKGNLGAAVTRNQPYSIYNGTEMIIMDRRTQRLVNANTPVGTDLVNRDFPATHPYYRRGATAKVVY